MDGLGIRQVRDAVGFAAGLVVLTASIVMLFTGMRDVMAIGGSCGSGGPYVVATPCPQGTGGLMVGGMLGWFAGAGLTGLFGSRLGKTYGAWAFMGWPALFLALGWNFWEFGVDPVSGSGADVALVVCAVIFFLMGAVPLLVAYRSLPKLVWPGPDDEPARGRGAGRGRRARPDAGRRRPTTAPGVEVTFRQATPAPTPADRVPTVDAPQDRPPQDAPVDAVTGAATDRGADDRGGAGGRGGLVGDLERLADLRARGMIGEDEYERAKSHVFEAAEEDA